MKKHILFFLLLIVISLHAQDKSINKFSFSICGDYPISFGNNFLNKAYKSNLGFDVDFQYNIKKKFKIIIFL